MGLDPIKVKMKDLQYLYLSILPIFLYAFIVYLTTIIIIAHKMVYHLLKKFINIRILTVLRI